MKVTTIIITYVICCINPVFPQSNFYPWLQAYNSSQTIVSRIQVPDGYERIKTFSNSFQNWLRNLPLKKGNPPVYLFNGNKKGNQAAHFAVIEIDVGSKDLQQCADAVIRLRSEYIYSLGKYAAIHFNYTSGDRADFSEWITGYRPVVKRNKVNWVKSAKVDSCYSNFRKYLDKVFMYAGSFSLNKELQQVNNMKKMKIGDVFIEGGFPGHAVIVIDMAVNRKTGKKLFLIAQSYMPAQDIHVLKNPSNSKLSPWYELNFGETLYTPEWTFSKNQLKRF